MSTSRGFSIVPCSAVLLAIGFANPCVAQFRALLPGERVIAIGPVIHSGSSHTQAPVVDHGGNQSASRPCTKDCEKSQDLLPAPSTSGQEVIGSSVLQSEAAQSSTLAPPANAQTSGSAEQVRELKSQHQHDLNQAQQRIDHLSQLLKLCQQQAAEMPRPDEQAEKQKAEQAAKDAARFAELQAVVKAMQTAQARAMAERDGAKEMLADMNQRVEVAKRSEQEAKQRDKQVRTLQEKLEEAMQQNEKNDGVQQKLREEIECLKRKLSESEKSSSKRRQPKKKV